MSVVRVLAASLGLVLLGATVFRFPFRKKVLRLIVGTSSAVLVIAALFGVSGPRAAATRSWLILTRGLVDVGGYRLRLVCEGVGSPVVVMDAGLSQTIPTWGTVPASVAALTRVCAYDRAGLGESDPGPVPRTSQQNINELSTLLRNAGVGGPYVLVGHSFGGQNVRLYASEHPTEVVGMVLVDASHEDQYARFAALMPDDQRSTYLRHEGGENGEHVDMIASGDQVRGAQALPDMPWIVLTAQPASQPADPRILEAKYELQAQLGRLVPSGRQIMVPNSGHFIQSDQPQVVVSAIQEVVQSARVRSSALTQRSDSQPPFLVMAILGAVVVVVWTVLTFSKSRIWRLREIWKQ